MAEATIPAERPRIGLQTILIGVVAIAAVATVSYWALVLRGWEHTDDAFVEGHMVFLSPRVAGQVLEVHVDENQKVHKGDVLVRLDPADYEARAARARADLEAARNRMRASSATSEAAAAAIDAANAKLRHTEQELARARGLFQDGVGSKTALDAALASRDGAAAEQAAAEQQELAERAAMGNDAPVRQAEAALREAELALEHTAIVAPFDGTVGKKNVEPGANVSPGQALFALTEDSAVWVTANFKETQITEMNAGDAAEIRVDAFPDLRVRGRVESLSPATGAKYALLPPDNATGNFTKVVQRVPVRIAIDAVEGTGGPQRLPVGLSVSARVRVH
jgi:membrane fusion protein (multidrug efflux system)